MCSQRVNTLATGPNSSSTCDYLTRTVCLTMGRNQPDDDRAKRTLYVTGFNPKLTTERLLHEIFIQGGPVVSIKLFETHAYVHFEHEESVPYCLALFNDLELHGNVLRVSPRFKTKDTYSYADFLSKVRSTLMNEYRKIPPPNLPPRSSVSSKANITPKSRRRGKGGMRKSMQRRN